MKRLIVSILLLSSISVSAQDTIRMTLDSCVRYAYQHNITVLSAQKSQESTEASLMGAKLSFLPTISASTNQDLSVENQATRSGQYGVNGSLTLFNGLSKVRTLQQSKIQNEHSILSVKQTENAVGIEIISAYLTILMNEEKLQFQQEVLKTSEEQRNEGELKSKVGRILESDYLLLDANYTSSQSEIDNTRLTISDNQNSMMRLLCMENNGQSFDVIPSEDSIKASECMLPEYDSVFARAQRTMPDWQISQMNVDIARYNVGIAQSAIFPTLSLNAGTTYNEGNVTSDNPATAINTGLNTSVTLGLSIPIFSSGQTTTQVKKSKIALQQAELQHNQDIIDLENNIRQMYIVLQQSLNRFRASEALLNAYKASYEVYVIKYEEGAVTAVEMLQQQDKFLSSLNDYLQNKYSYILAEKQLDIYMGKEIKL